jgi:hypothetical protein
MAYKLPVNHDLHLCFAKRLKVDEKPGKQAAPVTGGALCGPKMIQQDSSWQTF